MLRGIEVPQLLVATTEIVPLLVPVAPDPEDAKALPPVAIIPAKADDAEDYTLRCFVGKEKVFYFEYPKALLPGHIYSHAGKDEYEISQTCEYHFDEMFGDDEAE